MDILVENYKGKGQDTTMKSYRILDYKILTDKTDLLLVRDSKMEVDDNVVKADCDLFEVFKVQFIASCKTDLTDGIIIAFYIGEGGELNSYVLSGLPPNYYEKEDKFLLIDYKSYSNICDLTNETKFSFFDYIKEMKSGNFVGNMILFYKDKGLNADKQKELWEQIDANKKSNN